jgi:hypothetical protein
MGRGENLVPAKPAMQAEAVVAHLQESRRRLAALEAQVPETALAAFLDEPGAKAKLAALGEKIRAVSFEIECGGKSRLLAEHRDQAAVAQWRASVQAMPVEAIVAGLTRDSCCGLCGPETGCAISGADRLSGPCCHPAREGLMLARYKENPKIMAIYAAACAKIGVRTIR